MEEKPSNDDAKTTTTTTTIQSLNDFPEHLLLHILSFLPTIDAIKSTTSVSRRWRHLWSSVPSLHFSYELFPPSPDSPADTRRRFSDAVNQTLILRQSSNLTSFRLQFDFKEYHYFSLITSWIRCAVVNLRALELDLDFFIHRRFFAGLAHEEEPYFEFPFCALRDSQVRVLKLTRCELVLPTADLKIGYGSLRSVILDQIYLTDEMVSDLLNGCRNIEEFSLDSCWGFYDAKIRGTKISEFSIRDFYETEGYPTTVEIDCPNLRVLNISNCAVAKFVLKNSSDRVEANVWIVHKLMYLEYWCNAVKVLGHVRKLTVQNWWFKLLLEQKDVLSGSLKFHNLRWLELQTQYSKSELLGLAALLELSPNLDTLILDYLPKFEEDEIISEELLNKPINLSLPRLRQAKLKSFTGSENEVLILSLLKREAVVCKKIVVVPVKFGEVSYPPIVWVDRPNGAQSSPYLEVNLE